ncbi:PPR repeat family [Teratosphaeria destructans]|uniref:PPR repeat family n=1 Tax=Teratosphaeria destructans TaxID=418781 RepID=A0A9W7W6D0_9PEZI|nr:PPR repeat family [Teratosphaeria destructans]
MFECSACTSRAFRAVVGDALSLRGPSIHHHLHHLHHHHQHQLGRLLAAGGRRASSSATAAVASSSTSPSNGGQPYLNAAQLRHINRQESDGVRKQLLSPSERSKRRALEKEIKWLADPLKFTEHVRCTLERDQLDKALELCRMASSRFDCVVAWNRCIEWLMKAARYNEGLRVYNEMKKRGQYPDSYTYSMLLHGLVSPTPSMLDQTIKDAKAIKAHGLYIGMLAPTSRVQPSIIHTNSALKATAQAADLDAFWGIVALIPEQGPGAANHISYTTILDCIRHDVERETVSHVLDVEQSLEHTKIKRIEAVNHGRRIWQEVVQNWRAGLVTVDEPLVGAMARLLLVSHRMVDWDDVLSLIQQTTRIKRQIAPIGSAERNVGHVPAEIGDGMETSTLLVGSEEAEVDKEIPADKESPAAKAFEAVKPPSQTPESKGMNFQYAVPRTELLNVALVACNLMRIPRIATAYWDIFVGDFKVKPDAYNAITYLRLLRENRASKKAAKLMGELGTLNVENRLLYRLALEACVRDMKNKHAVEHATVVVNTMEEHLHPKSDIQTLQHYLKLGRVMEGGHALQQVVDRLYQSLPLLKSQLSVQDRPAPLDRAKALTLEKNGKSTRMLLREYVGAIDVLVARYSSVLTEEDVKKWKGRRNEVTALVGQGVDRYVAWDGAEAARDQPRRQRIVAGPEMRTPTSPRSTQKRSQPGRRAEEELDDPSPFSTPTAVSENRKSRYRSRADFDDQSDAVNKPIIRTYQVRSLPSFFKGADRETRN